MAYRNRLEAFERDNALIDILLQHKGMENAISTRKLASALAERGYRERPDNIHGVIRNIVFERHLPICSMVKKGYYWGKSKQDIQDAINGLQEKIDGLQERIEILKNFIIE